MDILDWLNSKTSYEKIKKDIHKDIKMYYKNNKNINSYEDEIIFNFSDIGDIFGMDYFIENNKKCYDHILPKHIKIKEVNSNPVILYNMDRKKKIVYTNIILKLHQKSCLFIFDIKNQIISYNFMKKIRQMYVPSSFYMKYVFTCHYIFNYYFYNPFIQNLIILRKIISKDFLWLIYKFHKNSI